MIVKEGSKWTGSARDIFHVISVIEMDGHTWVHYIKETDKQTNENREYSCYIESFLQRFSPLPE